MSFGKKIFFFFVFLSQNGEKCNKIQFQKGILLETGKECGLNPLNPTDISFFCPAIILHIPESYLLDQQTNCQLRFPSRFCNQTSSKLRQPVKKFFGSKPLPSLIAYLSILSFSSFVKLVSTSNI